MEPSALSQLVMDMYECWKTGQKYEPSVKVYHNFVKGMIDAASYEIKEEKPIYTNQVKPPPA